MQLCKVDAAQILGGWNFWKNAAEERPISMERVRTSNDWLASHHQI
jgi:hypothetical protein